uniref:Uncharacterized protein n=1 Tax=Lepeophtheirus salmonis TaxID=72036 RepID=A0A0K2UA42_LEPSM
MICTATLSNYMQSNEPFNSRYMVFFFFFFHLRGNCIILVSSL